MKTQKADMQAVERRHNFLIKVYAQNSGGAFNLKRHKTAEKANRLMHELRDRYNYQRPVKILELPFATYESVTGNGKYALD